MYSKKYKFNFQNSTFINRLLSLPKYQLSTINFILIKDYLKFLRRSVNAHGLHSPFMYALATKCFYDKTKYPGYRLLKDYHKQLLQNKTIIEVTDLGAGSRVFRNGKRQVDEIAKVAGSSLTDMKRLFRLVRYFKPQNILELGTSLGKSAYAMALGNPSAQIITVEGDENLAKFTQAQFKEKGLKNIEILHSDFDAFLDKINQTNQKFDLVMMDGNHLLEPTLRYFEKLQKHLHNDSVVIVDDIYWSEEMKTAWQKLKQHPNVKQSVDTFYFGLLFFREEQYPQDFVVNLNSLNLF